MMKITTKASVIGYLLAGCEKKTQRVGVEWESFIFNAANQRILSPAEQAGAIEELSDANGGATSAAALISFEAGGQIEFSSAPQLELEALFADIERYRGTLVQLCRKKGYALDAASFRKPEISLAQTRERIHDERYAVLFDFFLSQDQGTAIDILMFASGVHYNFDFQSEQDFTRKYFCCAVLNILLNVFCLGSLETVAMRALYTHRGMCWANNTINDGPLPLALGGRDVTPARYADYVMQAKIFMLRQDGRYVRLQGNDSFADFMAGRLQAFPGLLPSVDDLASHLGTLHPFVRMNQRIEMRSGGAVSALVIGDLFTFLSGILYCEDALDQANALLKRCELGSHAQLYADVLACCPDRRLGHQGMLDVLRELLRISELGAQRRWRACNANSAYAERYHRLHQYLDNYAQYARLGRVADQKTTSARTGSFP
jgi:glutamate--cysteine ligase